MTKFGLEQVSSPPPKWWRKLERTILIGLVPAATGFITQIVPAEHQVHALQVLSVCVAVVKSLGMLLGSGEQYPQEPAQEEVKSE